MLQHIPIFAMDPRRFESVLLPDEYGALVELIESATRGLHGRVVWNVSSTAKGGGVVELLRPLLGYSRGGGVDARWVVISGSPSFFEVTKRLHNRLHGFKGDRGDLGAEARATYDGALAGHAGRARLARTSARRRDPPRPADGRPGRGGPRDGCDGDLALPRRPRPGQRSCPRSMGLPASLRLPSGRVSSSRARASRGTDCRRTRSQ